jgi:hypothetical protein
VRSGDAGVPMTVAAVLEADPPRASCTWFVGGELHTQEFDLSDLEPCEPATSP